MQLAYLLRTLTADIAQFAVHMYVWRRPRRREKKRVEKNICKMTERNYHQDKMIDGKEIVCWLNASWCNQSMVPTGVNPCGMSQQ